MKFFSWKTGTRLVCFLVALIVGNVLLVFINPISEHEVTRLSIENNLQKSTLDIEESEWLMQDTKSDTNYFQVVYENSTPFLFLPSLNQKLVLDNNHLLSYAKQGKNKDDDALFAEYIVLTYNYAGIEIYTTDYENIDIQYIPYDRNIVGISLIDARIMLLAINNAYMLDVIWIERNDLVWQIESSTETTIHAKHTIDLFAVEKVGVFASIGKDIMLFSYDNNKATIYYSDATLINAIGKKDFFALQYMENTFSKLDVFIDDKKYFFWKEPNSELGPGQSDTRLVGVHKKDATFLLENDNAQYFIAITKDYYEY